MSSLTDKMPAKDFNAIFKNDALAKEISQLIEEANGTKKSTKTYRYTKDELLEIRESPMSRIPKTVLQARLAKANLSENIIHSLLKKNPSDKSQNTANFPQESAGGDFYDDVAPIHSYSSHNNNINNRYINKANINNIRSLKNRGELSSESYRDTNASLSANPPRYEKNYRPTNSESVQCWRTEKNGQTDTGNSYQSRHGGGGGGGSQMAKSYYDRYTQPRRYGSAVSSDRSYGQKGGYYNNRNGYVEEEPEWFSNGPESMNDFIDLKGFDDDENYKGDDDEDELRNADGGDEFLPRRVADKRGGGSGQSNDFGAIRESSPAQSGDANKNDNNFKPPNTGDRNASLNLSDLFDTSNASFMSSFFDDMNQSISTSSRAEKWFKSMKKDSFTANTDDNASSTANVSKCASPFGGFDSKSNSVMDLFQKFSQSNSGASGGGGVTTGASGTGAVGELKVDMSKATSLADLEASMLNPGGAAVPPKQSSENAVEEFPGANAIVKLFEKVAQSRSNNRSGEQQQQLPPTSASNANINLLPPNNNNNSFQSNGGNSHNRAYPALCTPSPPSSSSSQPPFPPELLQHLAATNPSAANALFNASFFKQAAAAASSFPMQEQGNNNHLPHPLFNGIDPRQMHPPPLSAPQLPHPCYPIPPEFAFMRAPPPNAMYPPVPPPPPPFHHPHQPPSMMINPNHPMPPHLAAQFLAHYNTIAQQQQLQMARLPAPMTPFRVPLPDIGKSAAKQGDENPANLANKLLKNSQFTPTSVFRKLKDHDNQSKASGQQQGKIMTSPPVVKKQPPIEPPLSGGNHHSAAESVKPFDLMQELKRLSVSGIDASNLGQAAASSSNCIPHPLSNYNQPQNEKNSNELVNFLRQHAATTSASLHGLPNQQQSATQSQAPGGGGGGGGGGSASETKATIEMKSNNNNSSSFNPSFIFSAMQNNEIAAAGGAVSSNLPPLPMKNALKLEDIEKF